MLRSLLRRSVTTVESTTGDLRRKGPDEGPSVSHPPFVERRRSGHDVGPVGSTDPGTANTSW